MKKIVTVALGVVCILMLSLGVFAESEIVEPMAVCNHKYRLVDTMTVYKYVDTTHHEKRIVKTYVCDLCTRSKQETQTAPDMYLHSEVSVSATCNGQTQTIQKRCTECKTTYYVTRRCPGAPHGSSCNWLPV